MRMLRQQKYSSIPRPIRVTRKLNPEQSELFPSVSAAARATGKSRCHVQGILSGRTGSRDPLSFEYEGGVT